MKQVIKFMLLLIFISTSTKISNAQINITNAYYEVSNDVIKIKSFKYSETSEFKESSISIFKNGIIQSQTNDGWFYKYTGNLQLDYAYKEGSKVFSKNEKEYIIVEFNSLKFSYPKIYFSIAEKTKKRMAIVYSNNGNIVTDELIAKENGTTEKISPFESLKRTYNGTGQLIEYLVKDRKDTSKISSLTTYKYSKEGLLISVVESYHNDRLTQYYYFLDTHNNWIQKIEVKTKGSKIETMFYTRKLTYKNGQTTGDTIFNKNLINKGLSKISKQHYEIKRN